MQKCHSKLIKKGSIVFIERVRKVVSVCNWKSGNDVIQKTSLDSTRVSGIFNWSKKLFSLKKKPNTYYNSGAVLECLLGIRREKRPGLGLIGEKSWTYHICTALKTWLATLCSGVLKKVVLSIENSQSSWRKFLIDIFCQCADVNKICLTPFQRYFSYILAVILLVNATGENHRPVASH